MERSEDDGAGQFRSLKRFPAVMPRAHWHIHAELVFCAAGEVAYTLGTGGFRLRANELALFWAALPHRVTASSPDAAVYVINTPAEILWAQRLPEAFVTALLAGHAAVTGATAFREEAFSCWHTDLNSRQPRWQQIARNEVACLMARVATEYAAEYAAGAPAGPAPPRRTARACGSRDFLARLVRALAEHSHRGMTVETLAASLGYNRRYLATRFRALTGVTPQAYIRRIRVARAHALLVTSTDTVETIAWDAGFGSVRQLYAGLKAETGLTPTQVRRGVEAR